MNNRFSARQQRRATWHGALLGGVAVAAAGLTAFAPRAAAGATQNAGQPSPSVAGGVAAATVAVPLPAQPPQGAVVLIGGKTEQIQSTWRQRYKTTPAAWTVDASGAASPRGGDITSRREFGDCYLHVEFRVPEGGEGGNSGIGLQGRYEIQILGDYGRAPESHGSAALYSQKAATRNASKRPGEWQTFDIIFRAPRFDPVSKQVTEKPRATVFQNGVLVQNNAEFTGMTGIQYGEYKEMTATGPLVLQGDHDPVQFRNVWIVPL